jgi:hypothetical protein
MSNVPAEAEEGLTSSRRVRDAEPHNMRMWLVCAISAARGMVVAGAWRQGRARRKVEADGQPRSGRAGRPPFSSCLRNWTCGPALAALEPGRCIPGPRRGLCAEGVLGFGGATDLLADRHKRCSALGQDQWITSVMLTTLLVMVACISAGMIVHHGPCERREW